MDCASTKDSSNASIIDWGKSIRPCRKITGMSAVLLPFSARGDVDWQGLENLLARTLENGLTPAVNMDTGYANLIDEPTRSRVLSTTQDVCDGRKFVAGAFVGDQLGAPFCLDAYRNATDAIVAQGGMPILFQSYGLTEQSQGAIVESYSAIGAHAGQFLAFELSTAFVPFGKIYDLSTYRGLLEIPECIGAKHSSLSRMPEWQRLRLRDQVRPEFLVLTGNDWAIDMVMYGSDYLLGISAFAPDAFAKRDALWAAGDPGFYELNDLLQYLGNFAFRNPVPAYKHNAAQFLNIRGWIDCDATHAQSASRSDADREVLYEIAERLGVLN
jgi:dihydrodipicolinate synthase/N-acetylneuraminate lyase